MLRVGLTGGLGSGKSTVAAMLVELGAHVTQADEVGRRLMQPGQIVFDQIVAHFGVEVLAADGTLNRTRLAKIAFADGRVEELNAIVHPATIAAQAGWMTEIGEREPEAICVVETALLFETKHGNLRDRFDRIVLVYAPEQLRIERFLARQPGATIEDARRRMEAQMSDFEKMQRSHFLIRNDGTLEDLRRQVVQVWEALKAASQG
ncbi:MAG: dephospho-CoA kinase [Acidobacteria bacterium]|nr:dephospho-CoA kinase [Acidobacteriota bacterium]